MKRNLCFIISIIISFSFSCMAQDLSDADEIIYKTAIELYDGGEPAKAIELYKELLHKNPDVYKVGFELGYSYATTGEYEKAVELLKRYESHNDAVDGLFTTEAFCLGKLNRMDESKATIERGMNRFPKSGRLCHNMGEFYRSNGDNKAAIQYYHKGINLDPECVENYYYSGLFYCDMESYIFSLMAGEIYCLVQPDHENAEFNLTVQQHYRM